MKVDLSGFEIELIKNGLWAVISDYCVSCEEEKPYLELVEKFNNLIKEEANKC